MFEWDGVDILVILAAVGFLAYRFRRGRQRGGALEALAAEQGFSFAPVDDALMEQHPFALFRTGRNRGVENRLARRVRDVDVTVADYRFESKSRSAPSLAERVTFCLVEDNSLDLPAFALRPARSSPGRAMEALGLAEKTVEIRDDPEFESAFRLTGDVVTVPLLFTEPLRQYCKDRLAPEDPEQPRLKDGIEVEGAGGALLVCKDRCLEPEERMRLVEEALELLGAIRNRTPGNG